MKTVARVQEVREGSAHLVCETRTAACDACSGGRGCALRWLSGPGGAVLEVPAQDGGGRRLGAGDDVIVEVIDGELLRAAAIAYLPPLAGLLAGAVAGHLLRSEAEVAAPLLAVTGLACGWVLSRTWLRRRPPQCRLTRGEGP